MILQLDKVSKYYNLQGIQNKRTILDEISLGISKTDSIAIVGPSGSGKSTLLNIMGTLDNPSSGSVKINGAEISTMNEQELAVIRNRHIGFVFQLHHLLPQLNVIENVLLPTIPDKGMNKKSAREKAQDLLDYVGLADRTQQKPGQLSVGECQRAAVVRAIINEPEILLADEPTGSLDQETAGHIGELLMKINTEQNIAIVIVTHSESLAEKLKVNYGLSDGKLKNIRK